MKSRELIAEIANVRRVLADGGATPEGRLIAADFLLAGLQRLVRAKAGARAARRAVDGTLAAYVERKEAERN